MFELDGVEAVGYLASALIVVSLAMTSVVRLRLFSLAGSIAFVVYAILIEAVPILLANSVIAVINVWFLRAELGMRRDLGASLIRADAPFLLDFLHFHLDDIHRFQPSFEVPPPDAFALLLTRDGLPAGALVGARDGSRLEVTLDYVLRAYRDSRLGHWLYGRGAGVFRDAGITTISSTPGDDVHREYLERVGFRREGDGYVLDVSRR